MVGGLRYDSHSRFGGHLSPRLSVLYSIDRMRLRASYSEGFRSPSIKELFMSWDHLGMFFIKGNDGLRPETSRMLSLSSEWQTQQLNLTLIASYNEIKNRISMVEEDGGNTQRYRNTSTKAQLLNLQASLRWRLPLGFHFAGDYVWLRDLDRVMSKSGRSLPFASTRPHNFTSTLGWEHRLGRYALSASYTLRGSSSVETAQYNTDLKDYLAVRHEGFTLSRLHAGIAWRDHVRLGAGIDNLWDKRHPPPPRAHVWARGGGGSVSGDLGLSYGDRRTLPSPSAYAPAPRGSAPAGVSPGYRGHPAALALPLGRGASPYCPRRG